MQVEFLNGVAQLRLTAPGELEVLRTAAAAYADRLAAAELLARTYHTGAQPTPGLAYDDRLTTRLKCCATTAYAYLELPVARGGLRHARLGKKYVVTELAAREFLGDAPPAQRAA